ncbi:hypothetical protein FHS32_004199 [Streptomyces albaduncus]|uniref:Uncharacterized protein n=1 Tax=Streptomyces griseoloalbus TaxID=67303 RepID=A0A7W8BS40_9ACTN|nr:hypothetical protein [Streptomyces albaduncus]
MFSLTLYRDGKTDNPRPPRGFWPLSGAREQDRVK